MTDGSSNTDAARVENASPAETDGVGCTVQPSADPVVEKGREAWRCIKEQGRVSFDRWLRTYDALVAGRNEAMLEANTNQPKGSKYNKAFGEWLKRNDFGDLERGKKHNSTRSRLFCVGENRAAIEAWLNELPEEERVTLNHPGTIWRRWPGKPAPKKKAGAKAKKPKKAAPANERRIASMDFENIPRLAAEIAKGLVLSHKVQGLIQALGEKREELKRNEDRETAARAAPAAAPIPRSTAVAARVIQ
jgi:hypothetical protein